MIGPLVTPKVTLDVGRQLLNDLIVALNMERRKKNTGCFVEDAIRHSHSHLGHLADAFIQSHLYISTFVNKTS